jgi:hypothetical protein
VRAGALPLDPIFTNVKNRKIMAYGLIRVRNLSAGDIKSSEIHNDRQYESLGLPVPKNIHTDTKAPFSEYGSNFHRVQYSDNGNTSLETAISKRLQELKITPRKNSVVALEYAIGIVGSNKELTTAYTRYSADGYLLKCLDHIGKKHGRENIMSYSLHFDESNPHIHVIVLPIVEKEINWKNQKGSGTKIENRLCAREFTGDREKLRQMQQDYFEFASDHNSKLGIKICRGTLVEDQLNKYTRNTNVELGELRNKIESLTDMAQIKAAQLELEIKKKEFDLKTHELGSKIEERKLKKGGDNWKQGKDFKMGF